LSAIDAATFFFSAADIDAISRHYAFMPIDTSPLLRFCESSAAPCHIAIVTITPLRRRCRCAAR
jgi:hypothetical protein